MAKLYVLTTLCLSYFNVITADLYHPSLNDNKHHECNPNKIYKAENVTCICTEKGDWSNDQCHLYFKSINSSEQTCEPDKFIIVDCNVCRCGPDGEINKDQCTKHQCDAIGKIRRSNSIESSCEPNKWYSFAPCRICFCVKRHKLICNNENVSSKIRLKNYELSECSEDLLMDMKKLTSEKKALRYGIRKEHSENKNDENSSIESDKKSLEIEEDTGTKYKQLQAKVNKATNKQFENDNEIQSVKRKIKKSKVKKGTPDINRKGDTKRNQSQILRIKLPNLFDSILNFVLRKSLSINPGNKCKPGSNMQVGCNTCFCLTNGKLLCTEKRCK